MRISLPGSSLVDVWRNWPTARFTGPGLDNLARQLLLIPGDAIADPKEFLSTAARTWATEAHNVLDHSARLQAIDALPDDQRDGALAAMGKEGMSSPEGWAAHVIFGLEQIRKAVDGGDASAAAAAAMATANWHAMLNYKTDLEEAVLRGHQANELRAALSEWEANKDDADEEFWQGLLKRRSHVLAQALSAPAFILKDKAYVGGKAVDNTGGSLADFLLLHPGTHRTTLIELKAPKTLLLSSKLYRNRIYAPSFELSGAVSQVMNYAASLSEEQLILRAKRPEEPFDAARPECIVVIGNTTELSDDERKRAFNLYRSELRSVRVITYDELFSTVASLLKLFGG